MPSRSSDEGLVLSTVRRSVLITGCSSGIGYDVAHRLHKRGWQVFATCRQQQDCERLSAEGLNSFRLDYEAESSIAQAVETVLQQTGGKLDAVINNGAYAIPGAVEDLSRDAMRTIFEANLFGWHDLTTRLIPVFRQQEHGRIIQISSVLGFVSLTMRGSYQATKYALEGLTDTMRLELEPAGIYPILVEPGPIKTAFRDNAIKQFDKWIAWDQSVWAKHYEKVRQPVRSKTNLHKFELPPSAVTEKIIHALEAKKPKARYYVTTPTYIMGWAKRFLPTRMLDRLCKKI